MRHRGKIEAAIANARAVRALRKAGTPLHELVWSFAPADYAEPRTTADWQAQTPESKELSKQLKAAGFRFVGPTTVWAAMQACGVVNDHLATCWIRDEVERVRTAEHRADGDARRRLDGAGGRLALARSGPAAETPVLRGTARIVVARP